MRRDWLGKPDNLIQCAPPIGVCLCTNQANYICHVSAMKKLLLFCALYILNLEKLLQNKGFVNLTIFKKYIIKKSAVSEIRNVKLSHN